MRHFTLAVFIATVGCNSVLGIPERELLVDEDSAVLDSGADGTLDADETAILDTGSEPVDSAVDSAVDSLMDDTTVAETATDSGTVDTAKSDTAKPDTGPDTAMPDTAMPDTAMPDAAMPDTAVPDTAVDTGVDAPSCGVAGSPCCGAIPASCNTNAVCNQTTKTCVAATGACVRASDCGGSACGGPSSCGPNICYACTPTFGTKAFGVACSSAGECTSGVCDTFRSVCSGACSNGITADADCASFGAKVVCSELTYSLGGGASGKIGFCALGCDRDGDCPTGRTCTGATNEDANRVDVTCGPPRGATPYGTACASAGDCVGGSCITFGGTTLCTPFCAADSDCPAASPWKKCSALTFTRPKGGTQPIKMCTP